MVRAQNTPDGKYVDVAYVNGGKTYRVRAKHAVMACYNQIIPHLCPEASQAQTEAIGQSTKIPFVLGTFALRNWQSFKDAGHFMFYSPGDVTLSTCTWTTRSALAAINTPKRPIGQL